MSEVDKPYYGLEINRRKALGMGEVIMYWLSTKMGDVVTIETVCDDPVNNDVFQVPPEQAMDAFNHAFARGNHGRREN